MVTVSKMAAFSTERATRKIDQENLDVLGKALGHERKLRETFKSHLRKNILREILETF